MRYGSWIAACLASALFVFGPGCEQSQTPVEDTSSVSSNAPADTPGTTSAANTGAEAGMKTAVLNAEGMH